MDTTMKTNYAVGSLLYDPAMYDGLNTHADDLEFYRKWILGNKIRNVLELCCGTGRITIPLAQAGIRITGLDITDSMLGEAKKKTSLLKLDIEYVKGDMRSFSLPEKYHLIFIPFNSIHCLYTHEDIQRAFRSVRENLADDGYFIIDYFNPSIDYICEHQKEGSVIAEYATSDGRDVRIIQTMTYEDASQVNRIQWEYIVDGKSVSKEALDMRIFYPQELNYYLESNGYKIVSKYGDYAMSAFTDKSPTQLVVCQKK